MSPAVLRTGLLISLVTLLAPTASAFPPSGCVALCGGSSDGWDRSWDRSPPAQDTTPRPPRMSSREREGFLTAQKAYQAWRRGDEEAAMLLYLQAYKDFPDNDTIRRGHCTVLRNRAAGILNAQCNLTLALRYARNAADVCPEDPEMSGAVSLIRAEIERQASEMRAKLLGNSIKDRVKYYVQELEAHMERMTKPPNAFEFAIPGTTMFSRGTKTSAPVTSTLASNAGTVDPRDINPQLAERLRISVKPVPRDVKKLKLRWLGVLDGDEAKAPNDREKTANLVLDALEQGTGHPGDSLLYMAQQIRKHGANADRLMAFSYLQGL